MNKCGTMEGIKEDQKNTKKYLQLTANTETVKRERERERERQTDRETERERQRERETERR